MLENKEYSNFAIDTTLKSFLAHLLQTMEQKSWCCVANNFNHYLTPLAAILPFLLPANAPGKAMEDSPNTWAPATHTRKSQMAYPDRPGLGLSGHLESVCRWVRSGRGMDRSLSLHVFHSACEQLYL